MKIMIRGCLLRAMGQGGVFWLVELQGLCKVSQMAMAHLLCMFLSLLFNVCYQKLYFFENEFPLDTLSDCLV